MSKVSFTPIQPGDAASVTAPNATMTAATSGTGAINGENVRAEGIDERNLYLPVQSHKSYSSDGGWVRLGYKPLNQWIDMPGYGDWVSATTQPNFQAGCPMSATIGTTYEYAIIRYSFNVIIEGRVQGTGNYVCDDVGFRITRNGAPLTSTQRHVQNQVALAVGGASGDQASRSVQTVTLLTHVSLSGSHLFKCQAYIDTHGQNPGPDTTLSWVININDFVTITNFTGSVVLYGG
jgi:hypothetical protein